MNYGSLVKLNKKIGWGWKDITRAPDIDIAKAAILKALHYKNLQPCGTEEVDVYELIRIACREIGIPAARIESKGYEWKAQLRPKIIVRKKVRGVDPELVEKLSPFLASHWRFTRWSAYIKNVYGGQRANRFWYPSAALLSWACFDMVFGPIMTISDRLVAEGASFIIPLFAYNLKYNRRRNADLANMESSARPVIVSEWMAAANDLGFSKIVVKNSYSLRRKKQFELGSASKMETKFFAMNATDPAEIWRGNGRGFAVAFHPRDAVLASHYIELQLRRKKSLIYKDLDSWRKNTKKRLFQKEWGWLPQPKGAH